MDVEMVIRMHVEEHADFPIEVEGVEGVPDPAQFGR